MCAEQQKSKQPSPTLQPLFVYATLRNRFVRMIICRRFITGTPTTLTGYRKVGRTVVVDTNATVPGEIIYVSEKDLKRLDRYERVEAKYERVRTYLDDKDVWVYLKLAAKG